MIVLALIVLMGMHGIKYGAEVLMSRFSRRRNFMPGRKKIPKPELVVTTTPPAVEPLAKVPGFLLETRRAEPETLEEAVREKPRVRGKLVPNAREAAFELKAQLLERGYKVHLYVITGPKEGQRDMVILTSNAFEDYVVVFVDEKILGDVQTRSIS